MSVLSFEKPVEINTPREDGYVVVHPLDDVREEKARTSNLGRMPLRASVKLSLMVLRGYLILMVLLVLYHLMNLAGIVGAYPVS
jgi:hypothetical protein